MTILRVKFPRWPGWSIPECTLTSVLSPSPLSSLKTDALASAKALTVAIDPDTTADYYCDSPVFSGTVLEPSKAKRSQLVLKFALREDLVAGLIEEADVYSGALAPLQGRAIPRCYGLFVGTGGEDGQALACLVLEHCGECLHRPFKQQPLDVRVRILQQLGELHRLGLLHGDFAERNVLEQNGDIRLIDFDQTRDHVCHCTMDFHPGERPPDVNEFGCEHLWELCRYRMRIWSASSSSLT